MPLLESYNLSLNNSNYTSNLMYAKLGVGSARQIATQPHPLPGIDSRNHAMFY